MYCFARSRPILRRPRLMAFLLIAAWACLPAASRAADRPNILVILGDDMGYSDLGCFGSEIRTPNLDALAKNGLRFSAFYNSSRCCPSRASLLTGLYPHQAGIGHFVRNAKSRFPGYQGRLTDRCVTLAEVLKSAGYGTYAVGKWHVNVPGPTDRGFDEFYGFTHGYAVDSWDETMMVRLPKGHPKRSYPPGEYFATNAIADHALDFLDIARNKEEESPWFLYVAFQAAHFPVQAPPELTATYVDTYRQGWDVVREKRLERMKELGLIDKDTLLPPREKIDAFEVARRHGSMTDDGHNPPWDTLEPARQADLAQRMAVYAAAVEMLDKNVGRLVDSLREHGELDNTLILFMSDNGACAEWDPYGFDLNPDDYKNHAPGHGVDGGTPRKPNVLHSGEELAKMGGPGSMFSYGCAWANVGNTPLAFYKHYAHEGGIRSPFIAHWSGKVANPGSLFDGPGHVFDVMATCVDLSGAKYPKKFHGHEILPMEGQSLVPALKGEKRPGRVLVFEHEHNWAIRIGDWKLVSENGLGRNGLRPNAVRKLYNLKDDPTEQHDLSAKHPDRVESMTKKFLSEARRTLVLPAP